MIRMLMKIWLGIALLFVAGKSFSQSQACPLNINYADGTLTHWWAYTGNNKFGNGPGAIAINYDSTLPIPLGTIGARSINEYTLPSVAGIQVITNPSTDFFGNFPTVPTINGYKYNYSIKLGSTSIAPRNNSGVPGGGYIRGVSYRFRVPVSPVSQPYTMTYAYAMVLENGAHNSNEQPLISATIRTNDSVITCASPEYYLPTLNNANPLGGGATLDTAAAIQNGFSLSPQLSPHPNPNSSNPDAPHLQDVWFKPWTEVTFDLSAYRGQEVTLTFEADNCVPGGHFAYGYIAIRSTCAGLVISGDSVACINSNSNYSIPALSGATYQWSVPADWVINSGNNSNIINVKVGNQSGFIIAKEQNGCANLKDTLIVKTTPPTVPGNVFSDAEVCAGSNSTVLTLQGNVGNVVKWISSSDGGVNWTDISDNTSTYNAQNLNTTTLYKALVQNTPACAIDSSSSVTIKVDPKSKGGMIIPVNSSFCLDQPVNALLVLNNDIGKVVEWQSSTDSINWININPLNTDTFYKVTFLNTTTYFRTVVKDGVCPGDTSLVSNIYYFNTTFPKASFNPADTTICFGSTALLNALVSVGTNYSWLKQDSLNNTGNGTIPNTPSIISAGAVPSKNAMYILQIQNAGCPNILADTFNINVIPPIMVKVVRDTAVVIGEPVQFNATSSDSSEDIFLWSPPTYLNNPNISDPIGIYNSGVDSINYIVRATDGFGCYGEAEVNVKVFKTLPDIFVPNAFTPGQTTNNIFRPIPVGIAKFQFFRVYNRWGQLVYSTSQTGIGWNGTLNGIPQNTGTYVWMAQGIDFMGKTIFRKGTVVLIR